MPNKRCKVFFEPIVLRLNISGKDILLRSNILHGHDKNNFACKNSVKKNVINFYFFC